MGEETRRRLAELEDELRVWDEGNRGMYETVGMAAQEGVPSIEQLQQQGAGGAELHPTTTPRRPSHSNLNGDVAPDSALHFRARAPSLSSSSHPPANLSQSLAASSSALPASSAPDATSTTSRRARNNALHRNNDIELATEIGQSLLSEVRRLQALLGEKEEVVKELKREQEAMREEVESATVARKVVEESVGEFELRSWVFLPRAEEKKGS